MKKLILLLILTFLFIALCGCTANINTDEKDTVPYVPSINNFKRNKVDRDGDYDELLEKLKSIPQILTVSEMCAVFDYTTAYDSGSGYAIYTYDYNNGIVITFWGNGSRISFASIDYKGETRDFTFKTPY